MQNLFSSPLREGESEWLSVSDLMAGLMVIFLFIAIVIFVRPDDEAEETLRQNILNLEKKLTQVDRQRLKILEIVAQWQEREEEIYNALYKEFEDDLKEWGAEIERETLLIRFLVETPKILFKSGEYTISGWFQDILTDFYPRYIETLAPYKEVIDELRIEGHTSPEWEDTSPEEAYIYNMRLSQNRTREVLEFVFNLPEIEGELEWLQSTVTANGLSSSRPPSEQEVEDLVQLRRVEFRVRTKDRSEILRILEVVQ